jgi:hypothetical protein
MHRFFRFNYTQLSVITLTQVAPEDHVQRNHFNIWIEIDVSPPFVPLYRRNYMMEINLNTLVIFLNDNIFHP